jgi:hypothetical protein
MRGLRAACGAVVWYRGGCVGIVTLQFFQPKMALKRPDSPKNAPFALVFTFTHF